MDVRTFDDVSSPDLRSRRRRVDVYLPQSYATSRKRYPVVYMLDGQNLSDPALAFADTWKLPDTLAALGSDGIDAIVVGVHNGGERRGTEYTPWADSRHGGGGANEHLRFIAARLKPRIDRLYRTLVDRAATSIAGSSLGGLASLYAFFRFRRVFGRAAALSPALWFGDRRIFDFVERSTPPRGRLYLDVGTAEGADTLRDVRRMQRVLLARAFNPASLMYLEAEGDTHSESAWAVRLPAALRFLLARGQ